MRYLDKINSPRDLKKLDIPKLKVLAKEIRSFLIEKVSQTGGHLASNLGIVELTLAMHYCFNSPTDKFVFDVGHQSYVHKILTGRRDKFDTLRKFNGLSGFPKSDESPHDVFDVGHSSTSISSALGLAVGRDLKKENSKILSVIGDGSLTGGLAYEGLNNVGEIGKNTIIILNDNEMSISANVGGLSRYLNELRTSPHYIGAKSDVTKALSKLPVIGDTAHKLSKQAVKGIRHLLVPPATIFDRMGIKYFGPVDGNNIEDLIAVFENIKQIEKPVFLHIHTKKGKGYKLAEVDPSSYHGVGVFNPKDGVYLKKSPTKIYDTYTDVFSKKLISIGKNNDKVVAITAAMPDGTGLQAFGREFPKRFFDVGIAEPHAVIFAAGLAKQGFIPVVALYSTFLQRAYDQIIHDVCLNNLHVVFAIDRAGLVGEDGETHQGMFDLSYLSHIPNLTIIAPKNKKEFREMLDFAVSHNGPIAIRYPRGSASLVLSQLVSPPVKLGKAELVAQGEDIALVSFGSVMDDVSDVFDMLKKDGHNPTLINARFLAPIDLDMIKSLGKYKYVFTFEDNVKVGGFGSSVLNAMVENNVEIKVFHKFALEKNFVRHGKRDELFKLNNLDAKSVYSLILSKL